jgi:hypothetical protein
MEGAGEAGKRKMMERAERKRMAVRATGVD